MTNLALSHTSFLWSRIKLILFYHSLLFYPIMAYTSNGFILYSNAVYDSIVSLLIYQNIKPNSRTIKSHTIKSWNNLTTHSKSFWNNLP